jgi:hypothetical protein
VIHAIKVPDGKLIDAPGCYDISMGRYHSQCCIGPGVSSSGLRAMWTPGSPAHYFDESELNPKRVPQAEQPHFSLGRAAHHLLFLGRKGFDEEFVIRPSKWRDWRTDDAQMWRLGMIRAGKTIITEAELNNIIGMAESLANHPLVSAGVLDGAVERSLIYQDHHTGVWLKSRPDVIPNASGDICDLKTSAAIDTQSIARSLKDYSYHMQAALCGMACKAVLGLEMQSFSLVWVEKTRPWCVRVTTVPPEDLVRGQMQVEAMTRLFAECVQTGVWPGPGGAQEDAEFLGLNPFDRQRIDEELERLKGATTPEPYDHMELS